MAAVSARAAGGVRCTASRTGLWFLLTGVLLRLAFFFFAENNGGDALTRLAMTANWLEHPTPQLVFEAYLPLHFWLMAGLAVLLGNVALAGRLLSLVLSIGSLWLFWRLARELYHETAANLSLLIFCFYSLDVAYSSTSSSEVPYLFFVLAGLGCFFVYRRSSALHWLASSGICLTLGAAVRYEAWVLIFALALVLLGAPRSAVRADFWRKEHVLALAVFGITAGAWPAFWMAYVWIKLGHPLYFLSMQDVWTAQIGSLLQHSLLYVLAFFPGVVLLTLSPLALAGSLYALWLTMRERGRAAREFAFVLVIFSLIQFYNLVSGATWPSARYTMTLGTLLAVTSGHGLQQFVRRFFPRSLVALQGALAIVLALNLGTIVLLSETRIRFSDKFRSISPLLQFSHHVEDVGNYLKPRLKSDERVVIDNYNCESNIVAAAAGLPLGTGDRAFLASTEIDSYKCESNLAAALEKAGLSGPRRAGKLRSYMEAKHPRYLVYSERGTLRPQLLLPHSCAQPASFARMKFRCMFENEIYRIYEITYP